MKSSRRNSTPSASSRARATADTTVISSPQNLMRRYEQYMVSAREAAQAGDRVEAENLYHHAVHFYRTAALQEAGQHQ
ncbi:DUF4167 domain-containing protein [Rhizobium lentis]|uniref:DUF4167 domain-containing protein n=1 Tax=Rhizobium lentis TaxID=1138194 RepID=UPI001D8A7E0F|nr:DUF4167 domain-containing protein [Rhizobium lentis]MBX5180283.1 DUF4167 domain-containing protein [Rhizobium lentis]